MLHGILVEKKHYAINLEAGDTKTIEIGEAKREADMMDRQHGKLYSACKHQTELPSKASAVILYIHIPSFIFDN